MKTISALIAVVLVAGCCGAKAQPAPTDLEAKAKVKKPAAPLPTATAMTPVLPGPGPACATTSETCPAPDRSAAGCCPAGYHCNGPMWACAAGTCCR